MGARNEDIRMEDDHGGGIVDDARVVSEDANYVYQIVWCDGGGDPIVAEMECTWFVCFILL